MKRHYNLLQAYRFGREFYGLDLEGISAGIRPIILEQIRVYGDPIPQVIFFMLVPAYLNVIPPLKRMELLDGLEQLMLRGIVADDISHNFYEEYRRASPEIDA